MRVGTKKIIERHSYKDRVIETCGFCNRTYLALRRNNIADVFTLIHKFNAGNLGNVRGIGEKGYAEIEKYLWENYDSK